MNNEAWKEYSETHTDDFSDRKTKMPYTLLINIEGTYDGFVIPFSEENVKLLMNAYVVSLQTNYKGDVTELQHTGKKLNVRLTDFYTIKAERPDPTILRKKLEEDIAVQENSLASLRQALEELR
jgi:hypothetical protein